MKQGLLINDAFEFWPEDNVLISCNYKNVIFYLPKPASRCFHVLLNHMPNVVPQSMLFQNEGGKDIPPNTLYQNISILRKGIKTVTGSDTVIIKTVPKAGFKIDLETSLKKISTPGEITEELPHDFEGQHSRKISFNFPRHGAFNISFWRACCYKLQLYVYFSIFMFTAVSFLLVLYSEGPEPCNFIAEFRLIGEKDGCHFMGNFDALSWSDTIRSSTVNLTCDIYPWIYVSAHKNMPTHTLIKCNEPITTRDELKCISVYIKGLQKK
ncbi:winged helix-turn-helix domain-containing protein [Citrobacter sedlakii]|uniref:winged helix-turn-helix domain-containing protein n=1 Tax=Citrobacter sedlakii TaxID=67826 RepID=UPI003B246CA8